MDNLNKKAITITEAVNDGKQVKITDQDSIKYSLWIDKADGTETKAYQFYKTLDKFGKNQNVEIQYQERQSEYNGRPVTFRNIMIMGFAHQQSFAQNVAQSKSVEIKREEQKAEMDLKAFGMCKHGYLMEMFKSQLANNLEVGLSQHMEMVCERWAEASMRKLPPTPADMMNQARKTAQNLPIIQQDDWMEENLEDSIDKIPF